MLRGASFLALALVRWMGEEIVSNSLLGARFLAWLGFCVIISLNHMEDECVFLVLVAAIQTVELRS